MRQSVVLASACVLLVLVLLSLPGRVLSSPLKFSNWKEYLEATGGKKLTYTEDGDNKCTHGGEIRDLCERCTKFTKNEIVYPLCCKDQYEVRSWCKRFLDYTPDGMASHS